jgi:hypothetical protein
MHTFAQSLAPWALPGIILASALGALVMCLLVFRYGFSPAEPAADPESISDSVLITRTGHAISGACFAIVILLATVVLGQSPRSGSAAPIVDAAVRGDVDDLRQALAATMAQVAHAETRLGEAAAEAEAARGRLVDLEARIQAAETSVHRVSEDAGRAVATAKQIAADMQSRRAAAVVPKPTTPAPQRVAAPASPGTEPARRPEARHLPAPTAPSAVSAVPAEPTPAMATKVKSQSAATPRPTPEPEPDFGARLREDWELIKEESRVAGAHLRDVFRKLRDAVTPQDRAKSR